MDGDFRIDLADILKNIQTADVISIYFPLLGKTLLIDTRFTMEDSPLVAVVPMATSMEERFRALRKLRPYLPRPRSITVVPWPRYAESLVRLGVWQKVLERFVHSGHKEAVQACGEAMREIIHLEEAELSAVLR
ncbi:MAG: hypothetical protein HYX93_06440 [Chloroflexi bacterium]|nr:hypothetical protein [Chloroflexota bacterium]